MFKDIIYKIIDDTIIEIKKKENMDKINNELLNPIIEQIIYKVYPYYLCFLGLIIIFIIIIIVTTILTLKYIK